MFGYLVAAPELMTEPQLGRYRAAYCGLCRSLRARHGQISGLTLTYDMTFLVLFLLKQLRCCDKIPEHIRSSP